jgi:hypothetical protein
VRDTEQVVLPATDWSGMTPSRMWELIKDHDAEAATKQSAGWSLTWELLDHHHRRLEEYRDMLAARWRGPAADAFLARVDGLLSSLNDTRRVALANDPVLPHLSASLTEAKSKLEPVKQQWEANQAKLAAAAAQPAVLRDRNPSLLPSPSKAQQAQLHTQAVSIMTTLAQHTTEGYKALTMPAPYNESDGRWGDSWTPDPRPTVDGPAPSGGSSSVGVSPGVASHHDPTPTLASLAPPGMPPVGSVDIPSLASGAAPMSPSDVGAPVGKIIGYVPTAGAGARPWAMDEGQQWTPGGVRALPVGGVINRPPAGGEPARPAADRPSGSDAVIRTITPTNTGRRRRECRRCSEQSSPNPNRCMTRECR